MSNGAFIVLFGKAPLISKYIFTVKLTFIPFISWIRIAQIPTFLLRLLYKNQTNLMLFTKVQSDVSYLTVAELGKS